MSLPEPEQGTTLRLVDESQLEPGAVFRFPHDERPLRVLVRDADAVMYDCWWPHLDGWALADLEATKRQRISYYVTTVPTVVDKGIYLRSDPLSDDERALHRPDLPFTAVQDPDQHWSASAVTPVQGGSRLLVTALYLFPFGPAGGTKPGLRVAADNGSFITTNELLRKAHAVQTKHLSTATTVDGVGIYRSGLQRGLPAFYLWGAESRLHQ
ncbi:hypothetical protein GCM10010170_039680 [Dactylosporangium salmoneum]|uniref:Uncharacterized protein n=1 Tax=Dactylosporangium salmoneum TaxID=53361 RepID=A0ABP5TGG4_9ACTN